MDDADLYGDLYGADEYDDEPKETGKTTANTDTTKAEERKPEVKSAKEPSPIPLPKMMPSATTGQGVVSAPKPPPMQGQPIPTSSSIAPTSSIPTYVSASTNGYSAFDSTEEAGAGSGEPHVRPSEMRDEGKMFVGGLNWETTTESLMNYFSQFGKIDACTIMRDAAGRSRGFAFLTFEDAAAVNAVMVREHHLDGKIIDPKRAIPRLEHQRTQKLFVGGLAPSVTTDTLKQFFSQYGKVIDATVMVDRDSSRSKGFGFVTFEDGSGVEHLLGHGLVIDGKPIEVKLAQPRHAQQRQDGGGFNQYGNDRNAAGAGAGAGAAIGGAGATGGNAPAAGGQTTFDAQAMANLYQRMMNNVGGAGFMNPMMGGMMGGPMMGGGFGMGRGMGMMGGMGGMGANGMMGGGMMGGGMPQTGGPMGAMGRGAPMGPGMGGMNAQMGMQVPRGPRAVMQGQQGQQQQGGGTGPMRNHGMRGQNTYHPYGR